MAKQRGKRKKDEKDEKADATEGLPPLNLHPNVYHAFYNSATPQFNSDAAKLAWTRTLNFFSAHWYNHSILRYHVARLKQLALQVATMLSS